MSSRMELCHIVAVELFPEIDDDVCQQRIDEAFAAGREVNWHGLTRSQSIAMVRLVTKAKDERRREAIKARLRAEAKAADEDPDWL